METLPKEWSGFRKNTNIIIFGADTPKGKFFDVMLLWAILLSVLVFVFESVSVISARFGDALLIIEWIFTIVFTIEFILRIYCSPKPIRYIFSFFGLVDFLSILPTFATLLFPGIHGLAVIRAIRLLRIFKLLKLGRFSSESSLILEALSSSKHKLIVFLSGVVTIVLIIGTIMYVVEGAVNGFSSIPKSMYWAIVTLTTVGYGDLAPQTGLGQFLASIVMMLGYGLIAVPTGIFSAEIANIKQDNQDAKDNRCLHCDKIQYDDANYCHNCGMSPSEC